MFKKLSKKTEGFTIIEVLIVLAIAGLILLIVFLAVPALQRNGRNTTKRSDASKTLGAAGEFVSNNNGKLPSTAADVTTISNSANLSNGTTIDSTIATSVGTVAAPSSASALELATGISCNQSASNVTNSAPTAANFQGIVQAASTRSYVVLYEIEASGGNYTTQCTGS